MRKINKNKLIVGLLIVPIFALLALFLLLGDNYEVIQRAFGGNLSADEIRDILSELGLRGRITVSVLSLLQVVLVFLPAEPVQVLGGLTFGFFSGFVLCLIGVVLGNTAIYLLYRIFGDKIRDYFDHNLDIDFEAAGKSGRLSLLIFLLYLLPAIPYGIIAFLATTSGMKYFRYIIVTTLGVIPSVLIGVGLGHFALESSILITLAVFVLIVIILALIMKNRERIIVKINKYIKERSGSNVKQYKASKLNLPYFIFRILVFGKVEFKITETVEKIERPCIVLCNHGSFIDFAYAGTLLKKESPNFVVNRLYFYEKRFGDFLRSYGCFPKSIFSPDTESGLNCVRVIKRGDVLAMMPEARLSTVGKFEDIQKSTYDFLKKMGVHVYVINLYGDYLAKPKWGVGLRRGSVVEAKMSLLFTPEELQELAVSEIEYRTVAALKYDEFKWLDSHPEINYKSRRIAEGLENILVRCPQCDGRNTLVTKRRFVRCACCNARWEINSRYKFVEPKPFSDFAEWYEWQFDKLKLEIENDPNYTLVSKVELKHSSKDGMTQLQSAGNGVCTLSREGMTYIGTEYGEKVEKHFPISTIYRILFGAGVDFEIYVGKEIYFFIPEEKRSCVEWYMASIILTDMLNNS